VTARTRILVVDDSAFARKVVRQVLTAELDFEVVDTARDGVDALEKIATLKPDVVTLDLVMPNVDGVGVLEALRTMPDAPPVICVTYADEESAIGVAALAAGAFDVVHKPSAIASDRLYELGADLVAKVRAAASGAPSRLAEPSPRRPPPDLVGRTAVVDLVVIGASTGGPQALARLLGALPRELPVPVAVVLHMPVGYTAPYADRIDGECALDVLEARDRLVLVPGLVAFARAGMHLKIEREAAGLVARLDTKPAATLHTPSVDVLFESAAAVLGRRVLAVVLTGMGSDGLEGARALHAAGASILVESESSCVVYGMPRVVAEAGLAAAQLPLGDIARAIVARVVGTP